MHTNRPILAKLLLLYGNRVPYHPGKYLAHDWLRNLFGVEVTGEVCVRRRGLQWQLDPNDCMQSPVFWMSTRDRWGLMHIYSYLQAGSVVFDIGANFGYYSLNIAAHLKQNCQIFSFEPLAETYRRLEKNIILNHFERCIHCQCLGLSNLKQKVSLVTKPGNSGATYVSNESGVDSIQLTTLDSFCQEHKVDRLDLIKCDVEGFEERVLQGGSEIIQKHQPILYLEINPPPLLRAGTTPANLIALLHSYGYKLFTLHRRHLTELTTIPSGEDYQDCFCLPRKVLLK